MQSHPVRTSRRSVLRGSLLGGMSLALLPLLSACGGSSSAPAAESTTAPTAAASNASAPTAAPTAATAGQSAPAASAPSSGTAVTLRAHMVKKSDVSDWIEAGLKQNIDGWKDKHPNLTVELETVPGYTAEYTPKVLSMVSAGQIGDVIWYPQRHRQGIGWGVAYSVVQDLNPLAKAANFDWSQFFPAALAVSTWEGKNYWMDYIGEPICPLIAYNKTKVQAMGVAEPKDDWTFDELVTWAKSLTKDGVFGYYPADAGHDSYGSAPFYRQFGVEFTDEAGKKSVLLDHKDAFIAALQFRYNLFNTWKISPMGDPASINIAELLGSQKLIAGDIWPFRIQGYPAALKDFEWGFVYTPVLKPGDKRRSMLNEHAFGVTVASKHAADAFDFVAWICGKEMSVQGTIQGAKGSIARPDFWNDQRVYEKFPVYEKLKPIMETIESDYFVGNFRGQEYDTAFSQGYDLLQLGKDKPEDAAVKIDKLVQAVLDKDPA